MITDYKCSRRAIRHEGDMENLARTNSRRCGRVLAALALGLAAAAEAAPAWAVSKTLYVSGVTAPGGAVWLKDTTPFGGHLWVSDHLNGFCRLDPTDATAVAATFNTGSCLVFGATTQP